MINFIIIQNYGEDIRYKVCSQKDVYHKLFIIKLFGNIA
nr:MAG TPA: Protein of unknown function (DUF2492) [Caudoviricetes sp.]